LAVDLDFRRIVKERGILLLFIGFFRLSPVSSVRWALYQYWLFVFLLARIFPLLSFGEWMACEFRGFVVRTGVSHPPFGEAP